MLQDIHLYQIVVLRNRLHREWSLVCIQHHWSRLHSKNSPAPKPQIDHPMLCMWRPRTTIDACLTVKPASGAASSVKANTSATRHALHIHIIASLIWYCLPFFRICLNVRLSRNSFDLTDNQCSNWPPNGMDITESTFLAKCLVSASLTIDIWSFTIYIRNCKLISDISVRCSSGH